MHRFVRSLLCLVCFLAAPALLAAQPVTKPVDRAPATAPSRVAAVTVYQGTALVSREVQVSAGAGLQEIVISPLPPATIDSSLYTEGSDGIRVLSTRYRTRAVLRDTRAEVQALEDDIKKLHQETETLQHGIKVAEQDLQFVTKLENFTTATMQQLMEKGQLSGEATIALAKYVMQTRDSVSVLSLQSSQKMLAISEQINFKQRQLDEISGGSSRTEIDAVVVIDKVNPAAGTIRLNYLVNNATWNPQYRFHAGTEKDQVNLEYLAAIQQQSGEDWRDVELILSTAEPMLNAAPPELLALDISVGGRLAGGGSGGSRTPATTQPLLGIGNTTYATNLRAQATVNFNGGNLTLANGYINEAASLEQTQELLAPRKDEAVAQNDTDVAKQGPSVTYHLKTRFSVPSKNDQQLIEVSRIDLAPTFTYKAVPVLTQHVYRLAAMKNKSENVLLPGEATMYLGKDFVGRMNLPLVAVGEEFTVGFGVDPQLHVDRQLVNKSKTLQGGNQVHAFEYRIRVSSFKDAPVTLQVWDRLPRAEAEAVGVSLVGEAKPALSTDATYVRAERPQNLLRWDVMIDPTMNGEKALTIGYQFKLEYARDVAIGNFKAAK